MFGFQMVTAEEESLVAGHLFPSLLAYHYSYFPLPFVFGGGIN